MLGLLEKDFRLTLTRKQTMLIFFLLALIMGFSMDSSFLIGYLTMLATIIAVGTLSYDEFDNGLTFLMTLPFDRKTYVIEKYLFSLIMAAAAWLIGTVLAFIGSFFRHAPVNLIEELPMFLSLIPALFLSAAVFIPLQLKYGSEKSRVVLFLIFGVIAILIGANSFLSPSENPLAKLTGLLDSMSPILVLAAITVICALLYLLSCLWSIRIMEKQEF